MKPIRSVWGGSNANRGAHLSAPHNSCLAFAHKRSIGSSPAGSFGRAALPRPLLKSAA